MKKKAKKTKKKNKSRITIWVILIASIVVGATIFFKHEKMKITDEVVNKQLALIPMDTSKIIFLGDSITAFEKWNVVFKDSNVVNAGVPGDTTDHIFSRLDFITRIQPKKVFLMMGINDLLNGQDVSHVISNYEKVISKIKLESPETTVYVQSILPINNDIVKTTNIDSQEIIAINEKLKTFADGDKIFFIDVYSSFCDPDGKMYRTYAWDGLHPSAYGYLVWKKIISPYVE